MTEAIEEYVSSTMYSIFSAIQSLKWINKEGNCIVIDPDSKNTLLSLYKFAEEEYDDYYRGDFYDFDFWLNKLSFKIKDSVSKSVMSLLN